MATIRQIYQIHGLFAGPAPATGYHFVNQYAKLTNSNFGIGSSVHNLIQPILRVQSADYSINANRTEIKQLGYGGTVSRPVLQAPTVNLNFSYLQMGLINEARLGFYVNYDQYNDRKGGNQFYANNFGVGLLSGFYTKDLTRVDNELQWPRLYRDKRNLFIAVGSVGNDLNKNYYTGNDADIQNVISFGNSYLTSYETRASVGDFPKCSVSYICENMTVQNGPSGYIPALDARSGTPLTGVYYSIPSNFVATGNNKVLLPGDSTLSLSATGAISGFDLVNRTGNNVSSLSNLSNLGIDIQDVKIQSYQISMDLRRRELNSLTYKLPVDRPLELPVYSNLSLSMVIGDDQTGSFYNLLRQDNEYNVTIKLKNPPYGPRRGTAIQYDFLRASFENISFSNSIGDNKTANLSFTTEINPANLTRGMFMSGLLNVDGYQNIPAYYLLKEDGSYLLKEDGGKIVIGEYTLLY